MAEYERNKAGLHKEISSIFEGVPIPQSNGARQSSSAPAPDGIGHTAPKSTAQVPQNLQKPPAPSSGRLTQSLQEAPPVRQPELDIEKFASDGPASSKTTNKVFWQQIRSKLFAPKPGVSATRQKAMAVLVPVLSIVLILVLVKVFNIPSRTIAKPRQVKPTSTVAHSGNEIDWKIPALYPTTLRDPMQLISAITAHDEPKKLETGKIGKLIVRSIVYSDDNPSAVVGDQIVHEGDKILGATVVKISRDSVEFKMNDKSWTQKVR